MYNRIISDSLKCIKLGSLLSLIIVVLMGIIGLLINKGNILESVYIIRGALLMIGSLAVILGSMLILKKRSEKELEHIEEWKEKYKKFSYKTVIILNGFVILSYGVFLDWLLYQI